MPDAHPCFAGVFTNGGIERAIIAQSDLLIGVGLDPVELLPRPWTISQPIVGVSRGGCPTTTCRLRRSGSGDLVARGQVLEAAMRPAEWDLDDDRARRCRRAALHRHSSVGPGRAAGGGSPAASALASTQPRHRRRRRAHVAGDDAMAGGGAERSADLERAVDDGIRAAGGDWRGARGPRAARSWR